MKKDDDLQELKSKSRELDSNQFRAIVIIRLPDHMKDIVNVDHCLQAFRAHPVLFTSILPLSRAMNQVLISSDD